VKRIVFFILLAVACGLSAMERSVIPRIQRGPVTPATTLYLTNLFRYGKTFLHHAVRKKNVAHAIQVVTDLLKDGADPMVLNERGKTAYDCDTYNIIRMVQSKDVEGLAKLQKCYSSFDLDQAKEIKEKQIQEGAKKRKRVIDDEHTSKKARIERKPDQAVQSAAQVTGEFVKKCFDSVKAGKLDEIKVLLVKRLPLFFDGHANTMVHYACRLGNYFMADFLIKYDPIQLWFKNINDALPWHIAAYEGHLDILKAMDLADQELMFAQSSTGMMGIHGALLQEHSEIVRWMVACSRERDRRFDLPALLKFAGEHNAQKSVALLLELSPSLILFANPDLLGQAVEAGNTGLVQTLCTAHESFFSVKKSTGETILQRAAATGCLPLVEWLVSQKRFAIDSDLLQYVYEQEQEAEYPLKTAIGSVLEYLRLQVSTDSDWQFLEEQLHEVEEDRFLAQSGTVYPLTETAQRAVEYAHLLDGHSQLIRPFVEETGIFRSEETLESSTTPLEQWESPRALSPFERWQQRNRW
jgi:ankyrin repeat protein